MIHYRMSPFYTACGKELTMFTKIGLPENVTCKKCLKSEKWLLKQSPASA
jgi:hypothetical protein